MTSSVNNLQIGKGVVSFRPFTTLPPLWKNSTLYAQNDYVSSGQNLYKCKTGGTSAASPAAAPTGTTGDITDGTAVWNSVDWIDLGNAPKFEWSAKAETKDHFTSRLGTKTRDLQVVLTRTGSIALTLDEITMDNLNIALMGLLTGNSPSRTIDVFHSAQSMGQLKFEATNDVGPQQNWFFGYVRFLPGKAISLIGEDFTAIELDGEVNQASDGTFATVTES